MHAATRSSSSTQDELDWLHRHESAVATTIAPALAKMPQSDKELSPCEAQVFDLLSSGYLYKEIAEALNSSYSTMHTHIRHIYKKLQGRSRGRAVAKYFQVGSATH